MRIVNEKYYCDRCGKEKPKRNSVFLDNHVEICSFVAYEKAKYHPIDLCDDCIKSFKSWWKEGYNEDLIKEREEQ